MDEQHFEIRSDSDYDDEYDVSLEEIQELVARTEKLLGWFAEYLQTRW